jgi:hypothetical protein
MSLQPTPCVKAYNSAVDGIALSTPKNPMDHLRFVTFMNTLEKALETDETEIGPCGLRGYKGRKVAGVAFGHRQSDNHNRIWATGPNADFVVQAAIDAKLACKCTRVDPALTYELTHPFRFYGDYLRRRIRAHEKANGVEKRTPFTLFEQSDQDSGGTIGHRSSAIYPRIYDYQLYHHKESEQRIWRAELELKEEAAERAWEIVKASRDRPKTCASIVKARLELHGICPKGLEDSEPIEIVGTRPPTDWDRWFKWFQSTVIPSMDKRVGQGKFEEIRDALEKAGFVDGDGVFVRPLDS